MTRGKRTLIVALAATLALAPFASARAATYTAMIAQGNTTDVGDCVAMYRRLSAVPGGNSYSIQTPGWQYKSGKGVFLSKRASASDFVAAKNVDILYWSGHGAAGPARLNVNASVQAPSSSFATFDVAKTLKVDASSWKTSSLWKGSRLSAVVLSACRQLDKSSVATYAKAMKSSNVRVIAGYHLTSPTHPVDTEIANRFMDQVAAGNSIRLSWQTANSKYDSRWAVLCYNDAANLYYRIPGFPGRTYAKPASKAAIYRYRQGYSAEYDGEWLFSNALPIDTSEPSFASVASYAVRMRLGDAFGASGRLPLGASSGARYALASNDSAGGAREDAHEEDAHGGDARAEDAAIEEDAPLVVDVEANVQPLDARSVKAEGGVTTNTAEERVVTLRDMEDMRTEASDAGAKRDADRAIDDLLLSIDIPEDAELSISEVTRDAIDEETGVVRGTSKVIAKTYRYTNTYEGIPLVDNYVEVGVDGEGAYYLVDRWRNIDRKATAKADASPKSGSNASGGKGGASKDGKSGSSSNKGASDNAAKRAAGLGGRIDRKSATSKAKSYRKNHRPGDANDSSVRDTRIVYAPAKDGSYRLAYEVSYDDGSTYYVDCESGDVQP